MSSRSQIPAFVLGLSTAGLAAVRSLGRAGVPVVGFAPAPNQPGLRSRYCKAGTCPDPVHAPELLLEHLLRASAGEHDRPVLLCTTDEFVAFACAHRAALEQAFRVALPPESTADLLLDKRRQYEAAARLGVPHPVSFYPDDLPDVRRIAAELDYPAFVKPHASHLWREHHENGPNAKGIEVRSPGELEAAFQHVFALGLRALVQSIVAGPASALIELYAYVARDGELLALFSARKVRQFPVGFGTGTLVESVESAELVDAGLRLLRGIGYRGFGAVEF
jgi:D-aspartate ligase